MLGGRCDGGEEMDDGGKGKGGGRCRGRCDGEGLLLCAEKLLYLRTMEKKVVPNEEFFANVIQMLSAGKKVTIPVKGFSMLPFIRGGRDQVVLGRMDRGPEKGDVVLFHMGSKYILHRVIRVDGPMVTTRGDGVPSATETFPASDVDAVVLKVLRAKKAKAASGTETSPGPVVARADMDDEAIRFVETEPYQKEKVAVWDALMPLRRYILAVYRRLPWNRTWVKENV